MNVEWSSVFALFPTAESRRRSEAVVSEGKVELVSTCEAEEEAEAEVQEDDDKVP